MFIFTILFALVLLLQSLAAQITDPVIAADPAALLRDMASNVSSYHNNLMSQMGNTGSFQIPPAFLSLLNSSLVSPTLANLIRSASIQSSSSTVNPSNILNRNTGILDPIQANIDANALNVAAASLGMSSGKCRTSQS